MRFVAFAASLTILASSAVAQDVPDTDSVKYCQSVSALYTDGPIKEMAIKTCMDLEGSSAEKLKARWSIVPVEAQKSCVALLKFGAAVSSQGLLGCAALSVGTACMDGSMTCK